MNAWKPLPPPGLLAALAALALPLLTGCMRVDYIHVYPCREVVAAHSYRDTSANQDYLFIAYRAKGQGRDIFVARIAGKTLHGGVGTLWMHVSSDMPGGGGLLYLPERVLRFVFRRPRDETTTIPKAAQPVPVVKLKPDVAEPPPLPPGIPMQVCYWPSGGPSMPRDGVLVLVRTDTGVVAQRLVALEVVLELPWLYEPCLPAGLVFDLATLPVRFVVLVARIATGDEGWPFPPEHFARSGG